MVLFHGRGFLIGDHIRDYTKLPEGPLCPVKGSLIRLILTPSHLNIRHRVPIKET